MLKSIHALPHDEGLLERAYFVTLKLCATEKAVSDFNRNICLLYPSRH